MGGINHAPTTKSSLDITVAGARDLTEGLAELMLGNVAIEQCISVGNTQFAQGREFLMQAALHFRASADYLDGVRQALGRLFAVITDGTYTPFDPRKFDVEAFVRDAQELDLLPECRMATRAVHDCRQFGHSGMFNHLDVLVGLAEQAVTELAAATDVMVDGPEGRQGYFWFTVETNRPGADGNQAWRPLFLRASTAYQNLYSYWKVSAAICTETHLRCTGMPSLLVQQAVALAPA